MAKNTGELGGQFADVQVAVEGGKIRGSWVDHVMGLNS